MLGVFLWLEAKRGARGMMPFALFATPTFIGLTLLTFFLYASLGGLFLLPYIRIEGYSAMAAGAALLPLPILIGLGSPLMGRLTARYGGRLLLAVGAAVVAAGLALYRRHGRHRLLGRHSAGDAAGSERSGGERRTLDHHHDCLGRRDHVGTASGFNSAVARIAGLIATALLGFVFAQQADAFIAAFRVAALVGAVSAAVAAGCALFLIRPLAHGGT